MTKLVDMEHAVAETITNGQSLYLSGFTHLIPFAFGHEIIRQRYQDLHLIRMTPDLIYDQMIAAGCASEVTFSWAGNPGVGSLRGFRRAVEDGVPNRIHIDEHSHFGLVSRLAAGAQDLPLLPLRTYIGSSYVEQNNDIRIIENPYDSGMSEVPVVRALKPDVAVVHAQRADADGNAHVWGITGEIVEAVFAAETVILSVEEVVNTDTIRSDPNRTLIPGTAVDYVVNEPYGAHPSYAQGYYNRDNKAYLAWDDQSETHESTEEWLEEWVYDVENRTEYLEKMETKRFLDMQPRADYGTPIDMGKY